MLRFVILLIALRSPFAPPASASESWRETLSPHFQIHHEQPFLPSGLVMGLEKMHNRLRKDLSLFAPWLSRERVQIYIYRDRQSYLRGRHRPPAWSNGIADYDRRLVVTHVQDSPRKLLEVLGHETTHLLMQAYWADRRQTPPAWLDEGVAMVEEGAPGEPSSWRQAVGHLQGRNVLPLRDFLSMTPGKEIATKQGIALWYVQAYALAYFLLREKSSMQFYGLCGAMRDGVGLEQAFWRAYRFRDLDALEDAWRRWLKLPVNAEKPAPLLRLAPHHP